MDWAAAFGQTEAVRWLSENRTEGCTNDAMGEAYEITSCFARNVSPQVSGDGLCCVSVCGKPPLGWRVFSEAGVTFLICPKAIEARYRGYHYRMGVHFVRISNDHNVIHQACTLSNAYRMAFGSASAKFHQNVL